MAEPKKAGDIYQAALETPKNVKAEILNGVLHLSSPTLPHQIVATNLTEELGPPFRRGRGGPGGWLIIHEPELHLGPDVLEPDLAGWRRERMPSVAHDQAFSELAPDWVCEILSKSTEKVDRTDKLQIYGAHGVSHAWLVHPVRRTVEIYRRHEGAWLLVATHKDDDRARLEPFDAIELDLATLWSDIVPPRPPTRAADGYLVYDHRLPEQTSA